ncbi:MAG: hypothetical protein RID62_09295 [Roseovarius sp.]|jgi:hypothetical protein|uniref:hypothetical protein n=1 Tax=Roseovarius sp. TaxID=1486281 RepID=UPI0032EB9A0A
MLRLSQDQIQRFEDARVQESARSVRDTIRRHQPRRDDGRESIDLSDRADEIAAFCSRHLVLQAKNMQQIARAHCRLGIATPEDHMAIPLRRRGFSEDERVRAYLYGLEEKKKRLLLRHSV